MMAEQDVVINLKPLEEFAKAVSNGLAMGSGPIRDMYLQWAMRYRGFVLQRFTTYSRGGGDWAPLKELTVKRRKQGKKGRTGLVAAILRDTSTMMGAMAPMFRGAPGAHQKLISYGIEVGFGGHRMHPSNRVTVADLARIHHGGLGRVPVRQIIVDPPRRVVNQMAGDAERAITKINRAKGAGP